MNQKLIAQGAEAKILLSENKIIKNRIEKKYRHPEIDKKIRKKRTRTEGKILEKAHTLINSPKPITIDETTQNIIMPYINGKKLSENLESLNYQKICKIIGEKIAKLHDHNIIHGDLTTSNMILNQEKDIIFIDFGLSFISSRIEDKAVDLHLIKEALEAKHFTIHKEAEKIILQSYNSKDKEKIINQLKKVELRGRYKQAV